MSQKLRREISVSNGKFRCRYSGVAFAFAEIRTWLIVDRQMFFFRRRTGHLGPLTPTKGRERKHPTTKTNEAIIWITVRLHDNGIKKNNNINDDAYGLDIVHGRSLELWNNFSENWIQSYHHRPLKWQIQRGTLRLWGRMKWNKCWGRRVTASAAGIGGSKQYCPVTTPIASSFTGKENNKNKWRKNERKKSFSRRRRHVPLRHENVFVPVNVEDTKIGNASPRRREGAGAPSHACQGKHVGTQVSGLVTTRKEKSVREEQYDDPFMGRPGTTAFPPPKQTAWLSDQFKKGIKRLVTEQDEWKGIFYPFPDISTTDISSIGTFCKKKWHRERADRFAPYGYCKRQEA